MTQTPTQYYTSDLIRQIGRSDLDALDVARHFFGPDVQIAYPGSDTAPWSGAKVVGRVVMRRQDPPISVVRIAIT
jgi:hypothetical protein